MIASAFIIQRKIHWGKSCIFAKEVLQNHICLSLYHHVATLPSERPQAVQQSQSTSWTCLWASTLCSNHLFHLSVWFIPCGPRCTRNQEEIGVVITSPETAISASMHEEYTERHLHSWLNVHPRFFGATIVRARGVGIGFKINHATTSTTAELAALHAALCLVTGEQPQWWSIFSDSKAAWQSLLSYTCGMDHTNNCYSRSDTSFIRPLWRGPRWHFIGCQVTTVLLAKDMLIMLPSQLCKATRKRLCLFLRPTAAATLLIITKYISYSTLNTSRNQN